MRILANAPLPCPYRPDRLTQALLPAMSRGRPVRRTIRIAQPRLLARLPPICRYRSSNCLRVVGGACRSRGAEREVLFGHGHKIGLEGGELERCVRTRVPV
jgi:hypothetical protein